MNCHFDCKRMVPLMEASEQTTYEGTKVRCEPCECDNWCEINHTHRFLTGHHERCPRSPNALDKALELIAALARGMELWGAEEDGIYSEAWDAYRVAKALQGVFLPPADPPAEARCKASPPAVCSLCRGRGWIIGGTPAISIDCPKCNGTGTSNVRLDRLEEAR